MGESREAIYGQRATTEERSRILGAPNGQRNNQLFKSAAALFELVAGGLLTEQRVMDVLTSAARDAGLYDDANCGERGVMMTIESGKAHGVRNPRGMPPEKTPTAATWTMTTPAASAQAVVPSTCYTLPELLELQIPDARWAVPGILSEGLTLLAGAPKQGKSWLALNLAITIAAGGVALGDKKVEAGDVLYLCLEDRLRRVQYRAKKVLAGLACHASSRLKIAVEWPRMDQGGLDRIAEWAKSVPKPTLFIVDVWQKFKPAGNGRSKNQYEEDYQYSTMLKGFADSIGASGVAIHHTKKSKSDDWLEDVSGTLGLAGAADGVLVLQRSRGDWEAKLCMTGRDIDEKEVALRFDPESAVWTSEGTEADRVSGKTQKAILDEMRLHPAAFYTSPDMSRLLNMSNDIIRRVMHRMAANGIIEKVKNHQYRFSSGTLNGDEASF